MNNRRKFIQQSSGIVGGSLLLSAFDNKAFSSIRKLASASDKINIGAIGINGMGWADVKGALNTQQVNIVALCDVDKNVLATRLEDLKKLQPNSTGVKTYTDYRKLLEQKDIDAVIIGTPDHWHALIMTEACMAGKDVYVEKPVGNSIGECRAMIAAKNKYSRIVQGGQWQRSQQHFKDAVDYVYTGQLGNIRTVKVWCYQGWMKPQAVVPDSAPPAGVDYTQWLGLRPQGLSTRADFISIFAGSGIMQVD